MSKYRTLSPTYLFFRMMSGIVLTGLGPIFLILVLVVHVRFNTWSMSDPSHQFLRARMLALLSIVTGLPIWLLSQLRLARGIRDGEWHESDLKAIRWIVFACPYYIVGSLTVIVYLIGICMRGRLYWLVSFGQLALPLGTFGDLYKQFLARDRRDHSIGRILCIPRSSVELTCTTSHDYPAIARPSFD
jgi:hypothetical protein